MTSTNMFQGLDDNRPSSRVLRPPGGASSNLFGGYEEEASPSRRTNKMASTIFSAPAEEAQAGPKRSNPPGGKSSGIFGEPHTQAQPQKPVPPGGPSSNIFGGPEPTPQQSPVRGQANKPKEIVSVVAEPEPPVPQATVSQVEVKEVPASPPAQAPAPAKEEPVPVPVPAKVEPAPVPACPKPESSPSTTQAQDLKDHEPHLGPRPRSHNRVLNPPGGKSSVVFY